MIQPPAFLILADDAVTWRIAGLAQLDRLALALNECAEQGSPNEIIEAFIFWHPDIPPNKRWLPRHPKLTRVRLSEAIRSAPIGARVIHSRLLVRRNGLAGFLETVAPVYIDRTPDETAAEWNELNTRFNSTGETDLDNFKAGWHYLKNPAEVARWEEEFLRGTGKPQDGIVSRYINRPISRRISRLLLQTEISPDAWTLSMLVLPILSCLVLFGGDYLSLLIGVGIFQIYSAVDGCDGEIARAKYLESERGGLLDTWTDIFGGFIFIIGLGYGLYRKHSGEANPGNYIAQAVACILLIGINEWRLRGRKSRTDASANAVVPTLYPRHQELIHHSGILLLGEKLVWWLVQFTKRDISIFVFFLLALISRSEWILPIWMAATAAVLMLAEIARWKSSRSALPNGPP